MMALFYELLERNGVRSVANEPMMECIEMVFDP